MISFTIKGEIQLVSIYSIAIRRGEGEWAFIVQSVSEKLTDPAVLNWLQNPVFMKR